MVYQGDKALVKQLQQKIIKLILKIKFGLNVINFSIDDYYKSRKDRNILATQTSKLFFTRGVPGTHYSNLLFQHLNILRGKNLKKS